MLNTYQATIDYLYQQLPMFQRIGKKAFKKDLDNIRQLCALLQMPHQQYPTIHIAGTNGKGSTAHGIAAILQASGLKVGLYTSPHYRDFRERIKINGTFISEAAVIDFVNTYKDQFSAIKPSFFELTVALAFHHFAQEQVDIAVIETGLGGILDSTNIINPILSIITNISYDHMNILGKTLAKIAYSKAGIIKPNIPVVMGEWQEETHTVFREKAKETNSTLFFADQILSVKKTEYALTHLTLDVYKNDHPHYLQLQSDLKGIYQNKNLLTILQSIEVLQNLNIGYDFTEAIIREGLANVTELCRFMGRWQILSPKGEKPVMVADSAHNPAGLQEVMQH
ncbi:MAG: bifunctional folylpolyglutamate synthase/dihydrofolate synthase, partial [Chitinophagales bacterium]